MTKTFSSSISTTTYHAHDPFASVQLQTPELADLVSRIKAWRSHKTFRTQVMPDELKSSIANLLSTSL